MTAIPSVRCFPASELQRFEHDFLKPRAQALSMDTEEVSLLDLAKEQWNVTLEAIRSRKNFFDVVGIRTKDRSGARAWTQPLIKTHGQGEVYLVTYDQCLPGTTFELTNQTLKTFVLVRAIAEPGNYGYQLEGDNPDSCVLIGPTMQSSKGHRAITPLLSLLQTFDALTEAQEYKDQYLAAEDGGRFLKKRNWYTRFHLRGLGTPDNPAIQDDHPLLACIAKLEDGARANFAWVELDLLRQLFPRGWCNGHLHSIAALLV